MNVKSKWIGLRAAVSFARCGPAWMISFLLPLPLAAQDPQETPSKPAAHGIPYCEVAPAIASQAKEALSGFAKSVLYLGPADPADPSILRAIYLDFEGEYWLIELIWKQKDAFLDIGDVTAESLGWERAEAEALIASWKKKPAAQSAEE